jgi:hypothetical protein
MRITRTSFFQLPVNYKITALTRGIKNEGENLDTIRASCCDRDVGSVWAHTELARLYSFNHTELALLYSFKHTELALLYSFKHTELARLYSFKNTELALLYSFKHTE